MYTQYDVIVIVTILIVMTLSLIKGGVKSVVGILKWYGAFFVALYFYPYVKQIMAEHFVDSMIANVAAVIGVYVFAVLLLALVGGVIIRSFGLFVCSIPDRLIGGAVGFAIGYFIVSFVHYSFQELMKDSTPEWFNNAETYEFTAPGANFIKEYFKGSLDSVKEDLGVDIYDEDGKVDIEKAKKLADSPEVKELMNNSKVKERMNDPDVQRMAKERIENAKDVDLDVDRIIERANQLKELGYEPEEIKSIIEQEQQIER